MPLPAPRLAPVTTATSPIATSRKTRTGYSGCRSEQLDVLLDGEQRRPIRCEQRGHRLVQLAPIVDMQPDRTAVAGELRPVRIAQRGMPDREVTGELLFADLAQRVV